MYKQLVANVNLVPLIKQAVQEKIRTFKADAVIADFTATPVVLACENTNTPCITIAPTPFAIETIDGVPSYINGWQPWDSPLAKIRNSAGRQLIRVAKRTPLHTVSLKT